jgi:hypothetical protein
MSDFSPLVFYVGYKILLWSCFVFSKDVKENEGFWKLQNHLVKDFVFSFLSPFINYKRAFIFYLLFFLFFVCCSFCQLYDKMIMWWNNASLELMTFAKSSFNSSTTFHVFSHFALTTPCFLTLWPQPQINVKKWMCEQQVETRGRKLQALFTITQHLTFLIFLIFCFSPFTNLDLDFVFLYIFRLSHSWYSLKEQVVNKVRFSCSGAMPQKGVME